MLDRRPLVARRVDRVEADELLQQLDRGALEVVGRHRVRPDYRRRMRAVPGASDDLDLALELADVADAITMARFRAEDLVVETKPDLTPVSEADRAVEQAMREHLASRRPDDTVFGEEYGESAGPPDPVPMEPVPTRPAGGSWTRSTGPRAMSAACRSGPPCSRSRTAARWWSASSRRRRWAGAGGRRAAPARSPPTRRIRASPATGLGHPRARRRADVLRRL